MRILDSCEGMTGASDIPVIYEYKNQIYYFCSNSIENHRRYHLKKINPMTDDVEIIDSFEYDAESTETDVMAVRRVSSQGTMVCQLFAYKEATVLKYTGGFYTIRFENGGGVNVRESRIYPTRKEAEQAILNRAR